jgi:hypothetical protein
MFESFPTHWLAPLHQLALVQLGSLVQLTGQVALMPLHRYGPPLGSPTLPDERILQVPLVVAPLATEHASQPPTHAVRPTCR